MMNTIATIETARGRLCYTLFSTSNNGSEHYGITVKSTLFDNETSAVEDISTDIDFVRRLMNILADNTVLPSTFNEIVEEYVAASTLVQRVGS